MNHHIYLLTLVLGLALASLFSAESSGDPRLTNQAIIYLINDGDSLMSVIGSPSGKTSAFICCSEVAKRGAHRKHLNPRRNASANGS